MSARLYSFILVTAFSGVVLLWLALQLPGGASVTTLIGPRTWPLFVILAMLAFLALAFVLLILRGPDHFVTKDEELPPEEAVPDDAVLREDASGYRWRFLAVLAVTVAYTVAMEFTGYLAATAVFAAIVNAILGERRPLRILLTTVAAVLMVALVFDRLLHIPLP
ncbi:MAG: tripartite tricarboxylate transporter TctB family protein [Rhodobacteraceae bacterium]|nr:tripartite tricarboxylate transporter TctB family protein [Paracoccaceae bacterium]